MARVAGWKIWYSDKKIVGKTIDDWKNAPDDDVQLIMLYYDQFSTITCRSCSASPDPVDDNTKNDYLSMNLSLPKDIVVTRRMIANQPWNNDRKCFYCAENITYDIGIRYRKNISGSNYYWLVYGTNDYIYGYSDTPVDLTRYPDAIQKMGKWTDDDNLQKITEEAMNDMQVSDIGINIIPGTTDI